MSLKHLKPQSKTMNPYSPKYLSTLSRTVLLDNLSRNSCILKSKTLLLRYRKKQGQENNYRLTYHRVRLIVFVISTYCCTSWPWCPVQVRQECKKGAIAPNEVLLAGIIGISHPFFLSTFLVHFFHNFSYFFVVFSLPYFSSFLPSCINHLVILIFSCLRSFC